MAREKPAAAPAVETDTPAVVIDPFAGVPCWEYVGPDRRIYVDVPVTVDPGDVVPAAVIPSMDGFWKPTTGAYTRTPDNFDGGVTGG